MSPLYGLLAGFALAACSVSLNAQPRLFDNGVANAANYQAGAVAPGEIVSLFGEQLGSGETDSLQLLVEGIPAPVFFHAKGQVNGQIPYEIGGLSKVSIRVVVNGVSSNTVTVSVAAAAPGVFMWNGNALVTVRPDGSLVTPDTPARAGEVLMIFATGEGPTIPPSLTGEPSGAPYPKPVGPVRLLIGGQPVELLYAGAAPGFVGLMQLNFVVPADLRGPWAEAALEIAGHRSQSAMLATTGASAEEIWKPLPGATWQWQLTGELDLSFDVEIYDIDLFDAPAEAVRELKSRGKRVICYTSVGAWEDWRPDAADFPAEVIGKTNGWEGERWLDIRRLDLLGPIIEARMDLCKAKGFDALEPDNITGANNDTGFPLTPEDQLRFNRYLAKAAHDRGLSIGLKNDNNQIPELVDDFDWALNEECFQYDECEDLLPFIEAGKAVFHVEYEVETAQFCPTTQALGFSSLKKNLDLDAPLEACR